MAYILFTRRNNIGSSVIRAVCWSDWSHVQILHEGTLYGASFPHGVGKEDLQSRLDKSSKAALVEIPITDIKAFTNFLENQLGKPYDLVGAFGLSIHRDWQSQDSWWCSEFVAAAIQAGGTKLFRDKSIKRVTPQHLYMLPYKLWHIK